MLFGGRAMCYRVYLVSRATLEPVCSGDGSAVRSTGYFCRGPGFDVLVLTEQLTTICNPTPGILVPSPDDHRHCMYVEHIANADKTPLYIKSVTLKSEKF